MVGSSMSESERRGWYRALGAGFVVLVGLSAALMALSGGASAVETAGIALLGLAVGAGLLKYLASIGSIGRDDRTRDRL